MRPEPRSGVFDHITRGARALYSDPRPVRPAAVSELVRKPATGAGPERATLTRAISWKSLKAMVKILEQIRFQDPKSAHWADVRARQDANFRLFLPLKKLLDLNLQSYKFTSAKLYNIRDISVFSEIYPHYHLSIFHADFYLRIERGGGT